MVRALGVVVVALVLAVGCADDEGAAPVATPTTAAPTTVPPTTVPPTTVPVAGRPSPGCDLAAVDRSAGPERRTLRWEGADRRVLVEAPVAAPAGPAPLVLNLHGSGSNGLEQLVYSGLGGVATARGAVVAHPDGSVPSDGDPFVWNPFPGTTPDDLGFLLAVVDDLAADHCIDLDRVVAVGLSNGAIMASVLACHGGGLVDTIVTVAAQVFPVTCPDGPVSVLGIHGTADETVPFLGGEVGGRPGVILPPVDEAFGQWAQVGGCDPAPEAARVADDVERRTWPGCADDVALELWVVEGGGHTWPGTALDIEQLGVVTRSFSASEVGIDFLLDGPAPVAALD